MKRLNRWLLCASLILVPALSAAAQTAADLETLKSQADEAYRQRDFPKAIGLADRVLAQAASDHVALYLRGSSKVEMGIVTGNADQIREGIADSREAIKQEGQGKPEYYLPYLFGMSHLSALEGNSKHAQTARTFADSILDREDLTAEQRANVIYQRAQANVQLKDLPAAEADVREAIKQVPQHLASQTLLADLAARTKTVPEAIEAYTKVVQAFPDNPLVYNNRGTYLQAQGRAAEAIADFNKAIQLDNTFMPAYLNRGFAYLEAGDPATAEKALTQALAVDPRLAGALSLRGTARLNQNKPADALADYRKVVELAPNSPMVHADLGFAQFFTGDYNGAATSFKAALRINPKLRFLLPWRLACETRLNQVDQQTYQATLSQADVSRDWIDNLILFQLGRVEAKELLQSANPTDVEARAAQLCEGYYFIGMELQRRGRTTDALAYWKQATQRKLPKLSAYRGAVFALESNGGATR